MGIEDGRRELDESAWPNLSRELLWQRLRGLLESMEAPDGELRGVQVRVARRTDLNLTTINSYWRGRVLPDPITLGRIALAYGINLDWVITGRGTPQMRSGLAGEPQIAYEAGYRAGLLQARTAVGRIAKVVQDVVDTWPEPAKSAEDWRRAQEAGDATDTERGKGKGRKRR